MHSEIPSYLQCRRCYRLLEHPVLLLCCHETICLCCCDVFQQHTCQLCKTALLSEEPKYLSNKALHQAVQYFLASVTLSPSCIDSDSETHSTTATEPSTADDDAELNAESIPLFMENSHKIIIRRKRRTNLHGCDAILHLD